MIGDTSRGGKGEYLLLILALTDHFLLSLVLVYKNNRPAKLPIFHPDQEPSLQPQIQSITVIEWTAMRARGSQGISLAQAHGVINDRIVSLAIISILSNCCSRVQLAMSGNIPCIHYRPQFFVSVHSFAVRRDRDKYRWGTLQPGGGF